VRNFLAPILGGRKRIRNFWGQPIACCWSDCWKDASTDHEVRIPHDHPERVGDTLTYAFCSDMHRRFWISTTLPAEHRGLVIGNDLSEVPALRQLFRP